jgi:hypothetical protein
MMAAPIAGGFDFPHVSVVLCCLAIAGSILWRLWHGPPGGSPELPPIPAGGTIWTTTIAQAIDISGQDLAAFVRDEQDEGRIREAPAVGVGAFPVLGAVAERPAPRTMPDDADVLPLRALRGWRIAAGDVDPRGMAVVCADGKRAGTVRDIWIDRILAILRYLEVEVAPARRAVMLPVCRAEIHRRRRRVFVSSMPAARLMRAPSPARPDRLSADEEDQIALFFAGPRFWRKSCR